MKKLEKWDVSYLTDCIVNCQGKRNKIQTVLKQIDEYNREMYKIYQNRGINQGKEEKLKEFREFLGINKISFRIDEVPKYIDLSEKEY